jgi:hypothetical protein
MTTPLRKKMIEGMQLRGLVIRICKGDIHEISAILIVRFPISEDSLQFTFLKLRVIQSMPDGKYRRLGAITHV